MANYTSLDHAKHNEDVCEHLMESTKYNDWIITTAFYSAMHYMLHCIFPLNTTDILGKSITADSFDNYCVSIGQTGRKHHTMRKLVEDKFPDDIASAYNQMLDASWTARYSRYQHSEKVAKLARKRLMAIKNHVHRASTTSSAT